MDDVASGVLFRGIGVKFDRYVIHILDSKSSRNASGHAVTVAGSAASLLVLVLVPSAVFAKENTLISKV